MAFQRIKPKRSKSYRPKPVSLVGGLTAIDKHHQVAVMALPLPDELVTDLALAYRIAFDKMLTGQSDEETWGTVTCSLNIALVLSERGFGKDYEPYLVAALDGAARAYQRGMRTGHWRYDGEAISAIGLALEVHDEQVRTVTKDEMRGALHEVHRRIGRGHVYQVAA